MSPNDRIPAVVSLIIKNPMFFRPFILQVGTDVAVGNLHRIPIVTLGERNPKAIIGGLQDLAGKRKPRKRSPHKIELPTLRNDFVSRSIPDHTDAASDREIPLPPTILIQIKDRCHSRLVDAGQIRSINQSIGQKMPVPDFTPVCRSRERIQGRVLPGVGCFKQRFSRRLLFVDRGKRYRQRIAMASVQQAHNRESFRDSTAVLGYPALF